MNSPAIQTDDKSAREQAIDASKSFIVQAPAGSGKTELLIQRYLNLLAHAEHPESVLAITFTRKAAAEMRHRIMQALKRAAQENLDANALSAHEQRTRKLAVAALQQSRQQYWQLLKQPTRLRIMTIDSLNASLVRRMPWLSGTGADVKLEQQPQALYEEAAWNTIRMTCNLSGASEETHKALQVLLLHLDNNDRRVARLLVTLLEKRDQWLRHLVPLKDESQLKSQLTRMFKHVISEQLEHLASIIPDDVGNEIIRLAAFAAATLKAAGDDEHPVVALFERTNMPEAAFDQLSQWQAIATLFLTKTGKPAWRKKFTIKDGFPPKSEEKAALEGLCYRLQQLPELLQALADARFMPEQIYTATQWLLLEALIEILPVTVAQLKLVFQQHSAMDFVEQALAARTALLQPDGTVTDLALKLDYQLQHILMDEFQDTSHSQLTMLETLITGWQPNDGRSLFLVGDPMQSIYRFREADVSSYLSVRDHGIASLRPESLVLKENYRSAPQVVDWFNQVFPEVLATEDDLSLGAVRYSHAIAARETADGCGVSVHPDLYEPGDFDPDAQPEQIIKLIQNTLQSRPGASISILVRSRSHLHQLFPWLQGAGIDFQAVEILPLLARPVIQDLLTVTRTLLHRHDRVAWLAMLRAPWCGLTLASLHRLANAQIEGSVSPVDIWTLMNHVHSNQSLSADEQSRLGRVIECYRPSFDLIEEIDLRTRVAWLWQSLGGQDCHSRPQDHEDTDIFFDVLESLDQSAHSGGKSVTLNRIKRALNDAYSSGDSYTSAQVQLMTIHKAKGLEFDVVILPALEKGSRSDQKKLLAWHEELGSDYESRLLLAPIHGPGSNDKSYGFVRNREQRREFYEKQRLLYVAATRARNELHLFASIKVNDENQIGHPPGGSFLELLEPHIRQDFIVHLEQRPSSDVEEISVDRDEDDSVIYLKRVPQDWQPALPGKNIEWHPENLPNTTIERVEYSWAGQAARMIGTVTHQYLYILGQHGIQYWDEKRMEQQHAAIEANLLSAGMPHERLAVAVEQVVQALRNVLSDDRAQWILSTHAQAQSEYAITGILNGQLTSRVIDRTFVDETGTRWIIDYKTSTHEGGNPEGFLDEEQRRYQSQLDEYAQMLLNFGDEPVKLGLYFPLLKGWREWAFQPL